MSLSGLAYRSMTLDLSLRGGGNRVRACLLDGHPAPPVIPAGLTGHHVAEIELA